MVPMVGSATCLTVESMLASLGSDTERMQAATDLVSSVDAAFGPDASKIGEQVRTLSGLPKIVQALAVDDLEFQQMLLVVLGNLSSDAFDPKSSRTKVLLRDTDVVPALMPLLCSASEPLKLYAAACLQNMCHDRELAVRALQLGAHPVLLQLVKDEQPMVQKFAAGALHNLSRAVRHLDQAEVEGGAPSQLMGNVLVDPDAEQVRHGPSRFVHPLCLHTAHPSQTHLSPTQTHRTPHTPHTPQSIVHNSSLTRARQSSDASASTLVSANRRISRRLGYRRAHPRHALDTPSARRLGMPLHASTRTCAYRPRATTSSRPLR